MDFFYPADSLYSFESLVTTHKTTRRHNPDDHNDILKMDFYWVVALCSL
jgi:hypothetical protein